MKRDLLLVAEQLFPLPDEMRLEMAARNRSIKANDDSWIVNRVPVIESDRNIKGM